MNNEEELISIVIVNWNSGNQLSDAINSIIRYHKGLISSVIIVDNASNDNSMTFIKYLKDLPFLLDIICNSENLGFGFACNQGAAKVKSEFILFLNPDTQLYDNSISVPLAFMKRPNNKAIGICGIKLVDEHNNFSVSAARFPTLRVMAGKIL